MKKILIPIIIGCLIISFGIVGHGLINRFYIDASAEIIFDRLTGEVKPIVSREPANTYVAYGSEQITFYSEEEHSGTAFIRMAEKNYNNIVLLNKSKKVLEKFTEYYKKCISYIKDDPLYYSGKSDYNDFARYSVLLFPPNIAYAYNNLNIEDPKQYIDYLLETLKK
jgi:hypothetical protein